jgi:hypothetical protein
MAEEHFTEQKIHYRGYQVDRLNISRLITDDISFVKVACIQRLFYTLPDQQTNQIVYFYVQLL